MVPSAALSTMKPPPPMLPASGLTTASANWTATVASTAFPPARMTSTPTWLASSSVLTTIPLAAWTGCTSAASSQLVGNEAGATAGSAAQAASKTLRTATRGERTVRIG